eukprot:scaffold2129_cov255-Pinguiococcus_pyrenoidosus.AAC.4
MVACVRSQSLSFCTLKKARSAVSERRNGMSTTCSMKKPSCVIRETTKRDCSESLSPSLRTAVRLMLLLAAMFPTMLFGGNGGTSIPGYRRISVPRNHSK